MSQATAEQTAGTPAAEAPAHFSASHRELTDALNLAAIAVPPRPPVPTLGGVVAHTQGRTVTLSAYDYEVTVSVTVPADTATTGRSVLDYDEFKKSLAAAVAGETKAAVAATVVTVDGEQLSTAQVSVPVTSYPPQEYPSLPPTAPPVVTVDGPEFFRQLARVLPAAGRDDTLPALTTVCLTLSGGSLRMATTDRYRLTLAEIPAQPWDADSDVAAAEQATAALVPRSVLALVAKYLGKYTGPIGVGIRHEGPFPLVALTIGTADITIRMYEGDFPPADNYLPTKRHNAVTLGRASIAKAAKKAQALTKAKGITAGTACIQWDDEGGVTLAPYYGEEEQAKVRGAKVDAEITDGPPEHVHGRVLAINARFLLDALDAFTGDTVTLHLPPDNAGQYVKPVLFTEGDAITGDGYRHLVHPLRLSK